MAAIEVHDGITNRQFHVESIDGTISIHVGEKRVVVPPDYVVDVRQRSNETG